MRIAIKHMVNFITKLNFFITIILFGLGFSQANAKTMICAFPTENITQKPPSESLSYIKLLEPNSKFQFDRANKISSFSSPDCNGVQSMAFWTNTIEINCKSSGGKSVNLKINLTTLKFEKTYLKNTKELYSLSGFCLTTPY